VNSKKRTNLSQ